MKSEAQNSMDKSLTEQQQMQSPKLASIIGTIGLGLKAYLTNWRNLLAHSLLGIALLVVAIWAPVNPWVKLAVVLCLIAFNVWRMRRTSRKNAIS